MTTPFRLRSAGVLWLAFLLAEGKARALARFNDGTDQVYVNGSFSIGHNSNLSASATGKGDYSYGATFGAEYTRHAGLIAVNASASYTLTNYLQHQNSGYNSLNPTYSLEFDKGTGRTVGALSLSATKSSQADAAANVHDVSWYYSAGLTFKYPVISRYSLSGSLSYGLLDYTEKSGSANLVNLTTVGASLGLFYILNDEHDLFTTYRYRYQQSSAATSSTDNALLVGVNGKVIWEITGNLAIGYQIRTPKGLTIGEDPRQAGRSISNWTGNAGLSWALNKKTAFKLSAAKDFNTSSTDATTDTTSGDLSVNYAYSAKLHASAGLLGGEVRYLGPFGYLPLTTTPRVDYNFGWNVGAGYNYNDHFHVNFSYNYLKNWSNLSAATFSSNGWNVTFTTRW
jgi:hypothetical protein